MDPRSTSCGYFKQEKDGSLKCIGFQDIWGKLVRFSELDGAVILAHDDEEIPPDECIMLDDETLKNRNVIKYLKDRCAINSLFAKVFGIYTQCPDIRVLQYFKGTGK